MDTGQLFMQLSVKTKADFSMPVNTSITSKPVQKNDSRSFDGALRDAAPKNYSKTEQPARTEAKYLAVKDVERKDEPISQHKPEEILIKSSNQVQESDNSTDQEVEKRPESILSEVPDVKMIPQNVDTSVIVAAATVAQPLSEGRMPQSAATEDNSGKIDGLVRAQNAIFEMALSEGRMHQSVATEVNSGKVDGLDRAQNATPELQLPEAKTLQAVTAEVEKDISGENAGTQNVPKAILTPSVEVADELLKDKSQVQVELLVKSADYKSELLLQSVNLQAGLTSQGTNTTGLMGEQLPLTPVMSPKQNLVIDGQTAETKTDSVTKSVEDVGQQFVKPAVEKQKTVLSQDPIKALPVEESLEAAVKNTNDVLLQMPVRTEAYSATAEFKFSRSASVEASLGMVGAVIDQPQEKLAVSVSDHTKTATGSAVSEAMPAEFSGSGSGFMGKDSEGFGQQNLDMPKPGLQQMTNGQVAGFTHLSSSNVEQTETLQQPKMASSENIAGQVKTQLSSREIKQGSEQITIQLSPDHLGDIKVNFRLEDQRLRVEIVAENRSARESLLQHADSLKESLARQNINMEKFEVTGGNNGSANQGGSSQPEWREMAKNRQSQQWLASGGYRTQSTELNPALPVYFARAEKSTLDLHF